MSFSLDFCSDIRINIKKRKQLADGLVDKLNHLPRFSPQNIIENFNYFLILLYEKVKVIFHSVNFNDFLITFITHFCFLLSTRKYVNKIMLSSNFEQKKLNFEKKYYLKNFSYSRLIIVLLNTMFMNCFMVGEIFQESHFVIIMQQK